MKLFGHKTERWSFMNELIGSAALVGYLVNLAALQVEVIINSPITDNVIGVVPDRIYP